MDTKVQRKYKEVEVEVEVEEVMPGHHEDWDLG